MIALLYNHLGNDLLSVDVNQEGGMVKGVILISLLPKYGIRAGGHTKI